MADPLVLPVAVWAPDLPDYPGTGAWVIRNVFPRTQASYGPVLAPARFYNALGSRCLGGNAFRDKLGNVFMFAGISTDLYMMKAGLSSWQNVSSSAGAYLSESQVWNFTIFNGRVIATNFGNVPQVMTLFPEGNGFDDLGGNPPRGKYLAIVKNAFVVFGNTYDTTNAEMPQRVWWSGAGNAESWPELGTDAAAQVQSGAVDLLGPMGQVQGFAPDLINADAVVFMEFGVRRMMYAGPPEVFTFLPVENARGTPAPSSIVVSGGMAYYWGQDGIYAFDGATSHPIGANKVDKFLFEGNGFGDVDKSNISRVVGVADPLNKLIWWAYPTRQNVGGDPDMLLCYSWLLDRFTLVAVTCETLLGLMSIGYTLDELETVLGYMTLEEVPAPFDSDVWLGGKLQIALFDTSHTLNYFTGERLRATVDTQEMQPAAGRRLLVRSTRPLVDGATTLPTVSIGRREKVQDIVLFTPEVEINSMGASPVRTSGRYVRGRIVVPAGSADWNNISGLELDCVPQGTR